MMQVKLLPQEQSGVCTFAGQFVATRTALDRFGEETVLAALAAIRTQARLKTGLDRLQVLEIDDSRLWIIDDGDVVTALLPEDY